MRILSRMVLALLVLGGLAYGSYSFGKYVLSQRLFKPTGAAVQSDLERSARAQEAADKVTQRNHVKGKAQAHVEELPADQAGDGPAPSDNLDASSNDKPEGHQHHDASDAARGGATDGSGAQVTVTPSPTDPLAEGTPIPLSGKSHKHRKHRHKSSTTIRDETKPADGAVARDGAPDSDPGAGGTDSPATGDGGADGGGAAPRISVDAGGVGGSLSIESGTSDGGGSAGRKHHPHHRERIREDSGSGGGSRRRHSSHSEGDNDPVPQPDSGGDPGGGRGTDDSPVPQPD